MITKCRHCGAYIDTAFGADPTTEHQDAGGITATFKWREREWRGPFTIRIRAEEG